MAVSLACMSGFDLKVPVWLRDICFILIGIGMGSGVTPQVAETAARWPVAILILFASLLLILQLSSLLLRNLFGFDRISAILASSPGHLSYILGLSADTSNDIQRISIVQSLRILVLTMLVPLIFVFMGGDQVIDDNANRLVLSWIQIIGIILVSAIVGWVMKCFRIPAAYLLGGMLVSSLTHISNLTVGDLPEWLSVSAFLVMGTLIGSRFSGITPRTLGNSLAAGLLTTAVAALISVSASFVAASILDLPINHVLIAFAPGGVETMAAMAVLLEVDPSFVAVHHVARLLFLTMLVPILIGLNKNVKKQNGSG